jgi:hypothetical protein
MKRMLLPCLFVLSLAVPCFAQETPAWEFYGGYSWERADVREYFKSTPIIYKYQNKYISLNGWNVSVIENLNRWFGGALDISGHYRTLNILGTINRERRYAILYGPRLFYRKSGVVLFGQSLAGVIRGSAKAMPTGPHDSAYAFAMSIATGVDVAIGKKTAIRLLKAEYFRTSLLGTRPHNWRASAGVVFYLGKTK